MTKYLKEDAIINGHSFTDLLEQVIADLISHVNDDAENGSLSDYECEGCKCQARMNHALLRRINAKDATIAALLEENKELKEQIDDLQQNGYALTAEW